MSSSRTSNFFWAAVAVFVVSFCVRAPRLSQSLWYDEMYTLVEYVGGPWGKVLAAAPGEYVPNNHVLYTVLAKLVYSGGVMAGWCDGSGAPPNEALLRFPAVVAGSLLPIALAWPFRRIAPLFALVLAMVAAVHPWMVSFSIEARGYSLMLLLGVIATHLVPGGDRRWPIAYGVVLALAVYTVPIALLLIPAHAMLMLWRDKSARLAFARGAGVSIILIGLLYLPMMRAIVQYYRHPFETTLTPGEFFRQLPQYALAGERFIFGDGLSDIAIAAFVIAIVAWSVRVGLREPILRPMLITLVGASVLGSIVPLISSAAAEVRFVPWAGLLLCVALSALISKCRKPFFFASGLVIVLGSFTYRTIVLAPAQPIREGLHLADVTAKRGQAICTLYIGARESAYLYGDEVRDHALYAAHDAERFEQAEKTIFRETGRKPCVVILFEDLARRRNAGAVDSRGIWSHLDQYYSVTARLDGRVSPVAVYLPK